MRCHEVSCCDLRNRPFEFNVGPQWLRKGFAREHETSSGPLRDGAYAGTPVSREGSGERRGNEASRTIVEQLWRDHELG
jgi:hypothetical protein